MSKDWLPLDTRVVAQFGDREPFLATVVSRDSGRDGTLEQYQIAYMKMEVVERTTWCGRDDLAVAEPGQVLPDKLTAAIARAEAAERERDAAYARGRTDERADVVEWLLTDGRDEAGDDAGKAIERGEHQTCRMRVEP